MEIMTREQYLEYRQQNDQAAILAAYYSERTESHRLIETDNFTYIMLAAVEDDPILQEKIDYLYPRIVQFYDKKFEINFLQKEYAPDNIHTLKMY